MTPGHQLLREHINRIAIDSGKFPDRVFLSKKIATDVLEDFKNVLKTTPNKIEENMFLYIGIACYIRPYIPDYIIVSIDPGIEFIQPLCCE